MVGAPRRRELAEKRNGRAHPERFDQRGFQTCARSDESSLALVEPDRAVGMEPQMHDRLLILGQLRECRPGLVQLANDVGARQNGVGRRPGRRPRTAGEAETEQDAQRHG